CPVPAAPRRVPDATSTPRDRDVPVPAAMPRCTEGYVRTARRNDVTPADTVARTRHVRQWTVPSDPPPADAEPPAHALASVLRQGRTRSSTVPVRPLSSRYAAQQPAHPPSPHARAVRSRYTRPRSSVPFSV